MISSHLQTGFGNDVDFPRAFQWRTTWHMPAATSVIPKSCEILCALVGMLKVTALIASILLPMREPVTESGADEHYSQINGATTPAGEMLVAGFIGYPEFLRSDVHLTRPGGTDLLLHDLNWNGEPFHFPIYAGGRAVRWGGPFGMMIEFIHNKAVANLGVGGHGRKMKDAIIDEVQATGLFKGQPPAATVKLNEIFDRLEFTHGHNSLLFTGLLRLGSLSARIRPYVGLGIGFSIPHTEIWLKGEADKTSEYQLAGPAGQALAGLEFRFGRMSYFIEYKFTLAWNRGELSGEQSKFNADMPGDLMRQAIRWWNTARAKFGRYETILAAHQAVLGAGVRFAETAPHPP